MVVMIIKSETCRRRVLSHSSFLIIGSVTVTHTNHRHQHLHGYEISTGESRSIFESFHGVNKSRSSGSLLQRQRSSSERGGTSQRERLHPEMGERKVGETEATG